MKTIWIAITLAGLASAGCNNDRALGNERNRDTATTPTPTPTTQSQGSSMNGSNAGNGNTQGDTMRGDAGMQTTPGSPRTGSSAGDQRGRDRTP